jgi:hypothetical protein
MNTHTPGPWTFAADDMREGRYSIIHNGPIAYCGDTTRAPGDGASNARLIAAAPDLLAALQELVAEFDTRELPQGHYPQDTGGMELARAAIAKAVQS